MLILGPLGFLTPWLLGALLALPVLWLILRAMPPVPKQIRFPGTRLLQGLRDARPVARHTPWWLLLLRVLAVAALILGFAGPVWKPAADEGQSGPLLIVMDGGWAAASDWPERQSRALRALDRAGATGQPAAVFLADGRAEDELAFVPAAELATRIRGMRPAAWQTRYPADTDRLLASAVSNGLTTLWLSDGMEHDGREVLLAALNARGTVRVLTPDRPQRSLELQAGDQPSLVLRMAAGAEPLPIRALGPDPQGIERELAKLTPDRAQAQTDAGVSLYRVAIDLPSELRNRITRFEVESAASAGEVVLADDRVRRRKVALVGDDRSGEGQSLLSPLHYLRRALAPSTDLIEGGLSDVVQASPDVIILADQLVPRDEAGLDAWVQEGGLLIRFAGARMGAYDDLGSEPMLPVRLRAGGRDVGGALSWGAPRGVAAFAANGPFAGLVIPPDATVRAQLLAEPAPELGQATIAQLSDGTPLVTRISEGQGQIVLFHTTANAEWTNLPISGLFVQMLDRLVQSARMPEAETAGAELAEQSYWSPELVLDGFGRPHPATELAPVAAVEFAKGAGPEAPAGLYTSGERRRALNAGGEFALVRDWSGARLENAFAGPGLDLRGWLIGLAALLLALDALGSALLSRGGKRVQA